MDVALLSYIIEDVTFIRSARSVAASYKPPMLVTRVRPGMRSRVVQGYACSWAKSITSYGTLDCLTGLVV